ncbi:type I restriction enzyme, S subunit [Arenibacter nanhaiticus]|uniref:Type I restriction enzyme, S subunit n=1 Tax=Arenibacter nanhaiticus TaxID=558155 RepID=A0A1M6FD71_9FLAO|nr:restriction endonuclease subunit S [Arenibacter nanhaiticus]SHI95612.1 type I restriction enzyme, S subunit [Arenibacter nanhaiticus]
MRKTKLPINWIISDIETCIDILDNIRKPINAKERAKRQGKIPYYGATGIAGNIDDYIFDEELVLLGEDGAPFFDKGKDVAYLINGKSWVNNHAHVLRAKTFITSNKFLLHFLNQFNYEGYVGGTTRLKLNQRNLKSIPLPLPPRLEQDRIVAKVDTLMAQIATMKKSMERIPELLKDFRQQVLTQAVTGKLTEEWRGSSTVKVESPIMIGETSENSIISWKWINLNEIAKLESGHTPRKSVPEYWENGDIPWISLQDIRAAHGKIIIDTKFKPTALGIENSSARLLPKGTVCFSRDISVGYTTIMGSEMATTQHFANWICGEKLNNLYLMYAFMSSSSYLVHKGKGTTVKTLYYKDLKKMMLYMPPIEEQSKIVILVENLLAKADAIEQQYKSLKAKIDTLPQAILHKAFKGELVEQLESDGDARELLREIEGLKKLSKVK